MRRGRKDNKNHHDSNGARPSARWERFKHCEGTESYRTRMLGSVKRGKSHGFGSPASDSLGGQAQGIKGRVITISY